MKNNFIYTITAMGGKNEDTTGAWMRDRVWGWFSSWEEAHLATTSNSGDMNENGFYNYIVIEELSEGIMAIGQRTWWYKFNHKSHKYEKIETPKWADGIINWSMG